MINICCVMNEKDIGQRIKTLREQRNLTQEDLAELLNVSNT